MTRNPASTSPPRNRPTVGSLFTGIGGLDWPWQEEDVRWHSEIDPAARKVLEARRPAIANLGDITQIDWETVEPVQVLIGGGFPCQPFSSAGRQRGAADARYLWPHVADAIRHLGPDLVLLENVPNLLGMPEWGAVVGSLADIGYDCRWETLRASEVGAPHQRNRVFAAAYPQRHRPQRVRSDAGPRPRRSGPARGGRQTPPDTSGLGRRSRPRPGAGEAGGQRRDGPGDDDRTPPPPDAQRVDRPDRRLPHRRQEPWVPPAEPGRDRQDGRWGPYAGAVGRWEETLGRPAPDPTDGGRLNPRFVEWMMGFPEGWVTDLVERRHALRLLGNAVVPAQAARALEILSAETRETC